MGHTIPAMHEFVGRTVENLRLVRKLGKGGFGVVYRAVDIRNSKDYAVKIILRGEPHSKEMYASTREILINSLVSDHQNVTTMHRWFEEGPFVFLVFELCFGGDLFRAITTKKLYYRNDDLVKLAFIRLIDAVSYCHAQGIFHRDLKPENILASPDGANLYLADFGLATDRSVSTNHRVGSGFYMSPECIGFDEEASEVYSTRTSDVWSLGVVLCNMLSGRSPWCKAKSSDISFCNFMMDPLFLRETMPISREACALLYRVFAYDPSERITLPQFRAAIIKVKTFFMTDEELDGASDWAQEAAAHCSHRRPTPKPVTIPQGLFQADSTVDGQVIDDLLRFENARDYFSFRPRRFKTPQEVAAEDQFKNSDATDTTGPSPPQSRLPITPKSRKGRDVDIEDLTDRLYDLETTPHGVVRMLPKSAAHEDAELMDGKTHIPSRRSLLRHAVQRFRGF